MVLSLISFSILLKNALNITKFMFYHEYYIGTQVDFTIGGDFHKLDSLSPFPLSHSPQWLPHGEMKPLALLGGLSEKFYFLKITALCDVMNLR